jgi:hypothetical protein
MAEIQSSGTYSRDEAWAALRRSVQADLDKVLKSDLTMDSNYALADALKGMLTKMDALEPGGVWAAAAQRRPPAEAGPDA